jgi:hypothetical protein
MPAPFEPVGVEDRTRLRELSIAKSSIASRLLDLELEKISVLAAGRRINEEQHILFRRLASERGIAETTIMDINPRTGEVVTLSDDAEGKRGESSVEAPAVAPPA